MSSAIKYTFFVLLLQCAAYGYQKCEDGCCDFIPKDGEYVPVSQNNMQETVSTLVDGLSAAFVKVFC